MKGHYRMDQPSCSKWLSVPVLNDILPADFPGFSSVPGVPRGGLEDRDE